MIQSPRSHRREAAGRPVFYTVTNFSLKEERPDSPLHLAITTHPTTAGPGFHTHDFFELVYVSRGSGAHATPHYRDVIYAGDCFLVGPWEAHSYPEAHDLLVMNVIFYPELFGDDYQRLARIPGFQAFFCPQPLLVADQRRRPKLHLDVAQQDAFGALASAISGELASRGPGYDVACRALFLQLVTLVSRCADRSVQRIEQGGDASGMRRDVAAAIAYLEQHYREEVRLQDVAHAVFLSGSRLSHVFTETAGMSLFDYLTRIRIDKASHLLRSTCEDIGRIAETVGFGNPTYFARVFRKLTGLSPSDYRRKAR